MNMRTGNQVEVDAAREHAGTIGLTAPYTALLDSHLKSPGDGCVQPSFQEGFLHGKGGSGKEGAQLEVSRD